MMKLEHPKDVLFVMVSYLPIPAKVGEMKTKPTQHAVRTLNSAGIQPDFIVARSHVAIDEPRRARSGDPLQCCERGRDRGAGRRLDLRSSA